MCFPQSLARMQFLFEPLTVLGDGAWRTGHV